MSTAKSKEGAEQDRLMDVIREVHSQHGDDICWMDIDRIFVTAGLGVPDRAVGNKAEMLANCARFLDQLCTVGRTPWPSYVDLEKRIKDQEQTIKEQERTIQSLLVELDTWRNS